MSADDKRAYFKHFLKRFVPDCSDEQWTCWQDSFLSGDSPWASDTQITVDMLKQFLMRVLTDSICHEDWEGWPIAARGDGEVLQVTQSCRKLFFRLVNNHEHARKFLGAYMPAHQRS